MDSDCDPFEVVSLCSETSKKRTKISLPLFKQYEEISTNSSSLKETQLRAKLSNLGEGLTIKKANDKGYGVFTTRRFAKKELIAVYLGELIPGAFGELREKERGDRDGCYAFFFKLRNKNKCIDATDPVWNKGVARLVNHSIMNPNSEMGLVTLGPKANQSFLCLFALCAMNIDEEVTYNYGDMRPTVVKDHPWIVNS